MDGRFAQPGDLEGTRVQKADLPIAAAGAFGENDQVPPPERKAGIFSMLTSMRSARAPSADEGM